MIYICTTCDRVHNHEIRTCGNCRSTVLRYPDYLKTHDIQVSIETPRGEIWKRVSELTYEELIRVSKDGSFMGNSRIFHCVKYALGIKEYEMVDNFEERELPLHIHHTWHSDIGAEAFMYRLKGEGDIFYPDQDYYADRYLSKASANPSFPNVQVTAIKGL